MFKKIKEYFETKRKIRALLVSTLESLSKTGATLNELMDNVHAIAKVYESQINAAAEESEKERSAAGDYAHE
ncbi:MAG: hypothetical protein ACI4EQ_00325 [Lachnospiraceae bacterium]